MEMRARWPPESATPRLPQDVRVPKKKKRYTLFFSIAGHPLKKFKLSEMGSIMFNI